MHVVDMAIVQTCVVFSKNYAVAIYYLAPVTVTDLVCLVDIPDVTHCLAAVATPYCILGGRITPVWSAELRSWQQPCKMPGMSLEYLRRQPPSRLLGPSTVDG